MLCALGMVNFQALLQDTPLPDKRLRTRATLLFQSLLQGQTANSLGMLSPADRTQESFTRGAYRFFDHEDVTLPALREAAIAHEIAVIRPALMPCARAASAGSVSSAASKPGVVSAGTMRVIRTIASTRSST